MKHLSRVVVILAVSLASVAALAQSAVGNWTGKVDVSAVHAKDKKEQMMVDMVKKMFATSVFKLTMKSNNTYSIVTPGFNGGAPKTETGKWSQSGNTITVTDPKGKAEKMIISANGRTMTMTPPAGDNGPKGLKLVFRKS